MNNEGHMDNYAVWNYETLGISFNVNSGRLTIFKTTLQAIGYPEYFYFLFTPEERCLPSSRMSMKRREGSHCHASFADVESFRQNPLL